MQRQKTSAAQLSALDENTLQQLLGAAWVMQEHNDRLLAQQSAVSPQGKNELLAEIVEMQNLIQSQQFNLRDSCYLIAQGLQRMLTGDGVAIGCLQDGRIHYLAALGKAAINENRLIPPERTLGHEVLRTGKLLQSPNPESDPRIPQDACHRAGAKSLVLVPVFHEQRVKGVLELWFSRSRWLTEIELRLCQLMAGLVTEAMVCSAQQQAKRSFIDERNVLLHALQHFKPQLERIAESAPTQSATPEWMETAEPASKNKVVQFPASANAPAFNSEWKERTSVPNKEDSAERSLLQTDSKGADSCRGCGHQFVGDEVFCGTCGMTRRKETDLQGKWASLWYMQQAHQPKVTGDVLARNNEDFSSNADLAPPVFRLDPQNSWAPSFKNKREADELPSDLPTVAHNFVAGPQEAASSKRNEQPELMQSEWHGKETARGDLENIFLDQAQQDQLKKDQSEKDERGPISCTKEIEAEPDSDDAHKTGTVEEPIGKSSMVLAPWTSAARARSWLESIKTKPTKQEWFVAYRANLYLVIAAVLLLIAVSGWGTKYSAGSASTGASVTAQPKLNWLQTLMVDTGIAVASSTPDYASAGNPNTQVWLDIHTALYYCPGAELYGKTPGGRFTTQKDAQQDEFEPALRQACN